MLQSRRFSLLRIFLGLLLRSLLGLLVGFGLLCSFFLCFLRVLFGYFLCFSLLLLSFLLRLLLLLLCLLCGFGGCLIWLGCWWSLTALECDQTGSRLMAY